ncbi:hypothetical protein OK016_26700 [Vibrio chagasii]|nr:hypothetical protein [Vibrio chagasii]
MSYAKYGLKREHGAAVSDIEKLDLNLLKVTFLVHRLRGEIDALARISWHDSTWSGGALKRLQGQLDTDLFIREGRGIHTYRATWCINSVIMKDNRRGQHAKSSSIIRSIMCFRILVNEIGLNKLASLR